MVDNDGSSPTSRRRHVVRLAVFAGFLPGMFYLVAVTRVVDVEEVPRAISATGPAAPLAYVVVSAVLGALLVPGAILAAGSGLLFGPVLGIFVTLGAAVGIAIVASRVGGRAGRDSARAAGYETRRPHRRADRTTRTVGGRRAALHPRHIGCARLFCVRAIGVPLWQMAVGAFIGSAPRAFVYTALGASIGNLSSPLAYWAIVVWYVTAIIRAFAARRGFQKWRVHASRGEDGGIPDSDREAGAC
jgi:uncharacterized membrane protein YdjX (TVP38/TMEM64 family)